jgi:hypothetical protein
MYRHIDPMPIGILDAVVGAIGETVKLPPEASAAPEPASFRDGIVLAAYPVRKPSPHVIKRDGLRIDPDNVCSEFSGSGSSLRGDDDRRIRFQDIVATALNTRRAIRELVLPRLSALEAEVQSLRKQLDRIERAVTSSN